MVASSPSISIPASTSNIFREDTDGLQPSDDEEGGFGASALSEVLRNAKSLDELRVGSLPMHLRRPVRDGIVQSDMRREKNSSSGQFHWSLPGAPFLSSREGPKDKLSR